MGVVKRLESNEKVQKRIQDCRAAKMNVQRNFVAGTLIIRSDDAIVLRGMKVSETEWQLEYNDAFWDQMSRETPTVSDSGKEETGNV